MIVYTVIYLVDSTPQIQYFATHELAVAFRNIQEAIDEFSVPEIEQVNLETAIVSEEKQIIDSVLEVGYFDTEEEVKEVMLG